MKEILKKLRYLYFRKKYKITFLLLGILSYLFSLYYFLKIVTSPIPKYILVWQYFFFIFILIGFIAFMYYFLLDQIIYQKKVILSLLKLLSKDEIIIFRIIYNKKLIFEEDLIKLSPLNKIRTLKAVKNLVRRGIIIRIPYKGKYVIKIKTKVNEL